MSSLIVSHKKLRCVEDRRNSAEERRLIQQLSKDDFDEECLMQQISMLQIKLDESRKNVQSEREYACPTIIIL